MDAVRALLSCHVVLLIACPLCAADDVPDLNDRLETVRSKAASLRAQAAALATPVAANRCDAGMACDANFSVFAPAETDLAAAVLRKANELRRNLEVARTKGYAETYHEARADIGGVAAAIVDPDGRPFAALSLALPMHRLTDEIVVRYGQHVSAEAARLSHELAGRVNPG